MKNCSEACQLGKACVCSLCKCCIGCCNKCTCSYANTGEDASLARHLLPSISVMYLFALCSKILFYFLKFPTSRTMKATTEEWIALEDEEDEEEEVGDDDAFSHH